MVRTLAGKHPSYYEATLQLREVSPEVVEFAKEEIDRVSMPVTKIKKVKNGQDWYLADSKFTKALGKKLQQYFGGKEIVTASLVTKKDGKELYRITVLFRGVPFKKGDSVVYAGDKCKVVAMGKDILIQNSQTGKKVHLKYQEMRKIKKI